MQVQKFSSGKVQTLILHCFTCKNSTLKMMNAWVLNWQHFEILNRLSAFEWKPIALIYSFIRLKILYSFYRFFLSWFHDPFHYYHNGVSLLSCVKVVKASLCFSCFIFFSFRVLECMFEWWSLQLAVLHVVTEIIE